MINMKKDLTGMKFNRWTVVSLGPKKDKRTAWNCICECGKENVIITRALEQGLSKSCGCLVKEKGYKHGHNKTSGTSSTYNSWHQMKQRCLNPKDKRYYDYGGRGITVCEKWFDFNGFLEDMGEKPDKSCSIDRIDNEKGYYKENCKWSTSKEQQSNKRINKKNQFGVSGVTFEKGRNKYMAQMMFEGKKVLFKRFDTLQEAIDARKQAEIIYLGKSSI